MRLNVEIKQDIYEELTRHAARSGRTVSDVVRERMYAYCLEERAVEARLRAVGAPSLLTEEKQPAEGGAG
jgi:hypothetical protein